MLKEALKTKKSLFVWNKFHEVRSIFIYLLNDAHEMKVTVIYHGNFSLLFRRKANWFGHIPRINCLLRDANEGRMTEVKGIGRRITQLLDDLRNRRRFWKLNEEGKGRKRWKWQFINQTKGRICIILHYNMYYFHFTLQEPC